jgi:hypothetical protein
LYFMGGLLLYLSLLYSSTLLRNWNVGESVEGDSLMSLSLFRIWVARVAIVGDCVEDIGVIRDESQNVGMLNEET